MNIDTQVGGVISRATHTVTNFAPGALSLDCGHTNVWQRCYVTDEPPPAPGARMICAACLEAMLVAARRKAN